ncbi:hypothetical protein BJ138DRAFT_1016454 [Hygrophoropsis aurantiaca]|uniref:Uncharacterized protein n=1 Tax=Hygrophoropsis aurantiaca TaxID=72124 RepID=A0ACB7ZZ14_9AGAM|nr:hypothetical protein BJ138DRAFT_1016454 [Hygrophoropsis aurantiaca]
MDVVTSNADFVRHAELLRRVGAGGVSSDESDAAATKDNKVNTFRRISPAWRSDQLANLNWRVDECERLTRQPAIGKRKKPGNQKRLRLASQKVNNNAAAPPRLPRNCYKASWLAGLLESQRRKLEIIDRDYNFAVGSRSSGAGQPSTGGPSHQVHNQQEPDGYAADDGEDIDID